jgi:Salmonella virulence plasmid 65kDa B protein
MALRATASFLALVLFMTAGTPYASVVHAWDPPAHSEAYVPADVTGSSSASPYAESLASDLGDTTDTASVADLAALEASDPERAASLRAALDAQASNPTITPVSLPSGDAKSAVTPQAISLPKAEGSIEGMGESFSPVLSSGTGTFSVPIALPPGRAGVQPSLGLSYSSSSGNGDVGMGWSLGMPFISRQTDRGLPRYDDRAAWHAEEDRFFYNGGQELVPVDSAVAAALDGGTIPAELTGWQQYRARVEGGFMRFFRAPDYERWVVQSKDGTRFDFGVLPTATYPADYGDLRTTLQTESADGTGRTFRWQLTRMSDTHGSTIYYRYQRDDGQLYTYDIHYVSPAVCGSTTPSVARNCTQPLSAFGRRVKFIYQSRQDANRSYVTGFRVRTAWRMKRIEVTGWNHIANARTLVRRYHLEYDATSFHSLLTSIQVEGRPDAPNGFTARVGDTGISEGSLDDRIVGQTLPVLASRRDDG